MSVRNSAYIWCIHLCETYWQAVVLRFLCNWNLTDALCPGTYVQKRELGCAYLGLCNEALPGFQLLKL